VEFGPLHYRHLEKEKVQALSASKGSYQGRVQLLSPRSRSKLQWWIDNIALSHKHITHEKPSFTIQSDASTAGWGADLSGQSTGGRWSAVEQQQQHINVLELRAALFGLKAFCPEMHNTHVKLELDNTTAIAYINHMGGSKSEELNQIAYELGDWCITQSISVTAARIPGVHNILADKRSRKFQDEHEWKLNKSVFQQILHNYPELNVDLFASRLNYQLATYASWEPDPLRTYIDVFTTDWGKLIFYAFPPFSVIQRCIKKIQMDQATGILVAPLWPTLTWFTPLLQLLYSPPWVFNQHPDKILSHPHYKTHPIPKLKLIVCPVSGNPSRTSSYRSKLPMCSWHHGEPAQKCNTIATSTSGWTFVIKDRLIHINQV
jgi:ribonuclease HI